ncbi:MAG TPA: heat-inducible transcriptional repressor HrcA [Spirochaetota bacterium]|nr:heat-inducible transcriptional repressor HrcA [Spirochaetota bacterium]
MYIEVAIMHTKQLNDREAQVLKAIVYEYIATGKPVGSRSFVQKYSFSLSPATMRNIMFDLEQMGYLSHPHTSAGRIPTDKGYRFYVDSLLDTYETVAKTDIEVREEMLAREIELDKIFMSIVKMLSLISKYTGIALMPKPDFTVVKHIELISLTSNDVLFIIVTRTGIVIHKKVKLSSSINQDDLYKYSRFLTAELSGYSLVEIRQSLINQLRTVTDVETSVRDVALDITELALKDEQEPDIYIDGIENLLHIPDIVEAEKLHEIVRFIEQKDTLRKIMEDLRQKEGVFTLIGDEIKDIAIPCCSIIASSYKIGNSPVGVVGVIGPTRMDYEKVVPLVDYTGKVVSNFLTQMTK